MHFIQIGHMGHGILIRRTIKMLGFCIKGHLSKTLKHIGPYAQTA